MRISVSVKTKSREELVEKQADGSYVVRVAVPPVDGQANERIRELLAEHFQLPKKSVELVAGFKAKKKIFEVP